MEKITRTITTSVIHPVAMHFEKGQPVFTDLPTIPVQGKELKGETALKIASKANPEITDTIAIKEIETTEKVYELPLDEFITAANAYFARKAAAEPATSPDPMTTPAGQAPAQNA
jgi:hypothetical protein